MKHLRFFRYADMYILPTSQLEEVGIFPLTTQDFVKKVNDLCTESRRILLDVWLKSCADILLDLKRFWWEFVPLKGDTLETVERFFRAIHSLLSSQLRRLTMRSLHHFLNMLRMFKVLRRNLVNTSIFPRQFDSLRTCWIQISGWELLR